MSRKPVVLSYAAIRAAGACDEALEVVPTWYPEGFPLTAEAIDRLLAHDWTWAEWLVDSPLCPAPLYEAYLAQVKPLYEAYWAQRKPLYEAYLAQVQPLREAYEAQRQSLLRATLLTWGGQADA